MMGYFCCVNTQLHFQLLYLLGGVGGRDSPTLTTPAPLSGRVELLGNYDQPDEHLRSSGTLLVVVEINVDHVLI